MLWASYDKEKYVTIDNNATSPGGRRRRIYREKGKISWKTRKDAGLYMQVGAGKDFKMQEACGMVRKAKRQEKAKQRKYKYENAPGRCGVLPYYSCVIEEEVNTMSVEAKQLAL